MEIKRIETYSLFEFCQTVQQNIQDGWVFDFESNENFPTAYGSMLVAGLVKTAPKTEVKTEVKTEEVITQDNTEIKRGRKPNK